MGSLSLDEFVYGVLVSAFLLGLAWFVLKLVEYFLPAIVLSLFIVYITGPFYRFLERRVKNRTLPIVVTILLLLFLSVLFVYQFVNVAVSEVSSLLARPEVSALVSSSGFVGGLLGVGERLNYTVIEDLVREPSLEGLLSLSSFSGGLSRLVDLGFQLVMAAGYVLLQVFIAFLLTFHLVRNRRELRGFVLGLVPRGHRRVAEVFLDELNVSLNAIFMGVFLNALLTGIIAYVIFVVFGVPYPALLSVVVFVLTILPVVGAPLVYVPLGLWMFYAGDPGNAIMFLLVCFVFISTIPDWVTRPLVIAREKKMNLMFVFVSFIGGAAVFGPMGFFVGPVLLAVVLSLAYAVGGVGLDYKQSRENRKK